MSYTDTIGWNNAVDMEGLNKGPVSGFILYPNGERAMSLEELAQHIALRGPRYVVVDGDVWKEIVNRLEGLEAMLKHAR